MKKERHWVYRWVMAGLVLALLLGVVMLALAISGGAGQPTPLPKA